MIRIKDEFGNEKFRIEDNGDVVVDSVNIKEMTEEEIEKVMKKREALHKADNKEEEE